MNKRMLVMIIIGVLFIGYVATFNYGGCGGGSTGSSTPPVPPAPSLITNPATNISVTAVTLNGMVNPNGVDTRACFQYSKNMSYGTTTNYHDIGSGTDYVDVSDNITGLELNTTYNFRIRASKGVSTYNGPNQTFTTLKPPPTCVTNQATDVGPDFARLNGTINPNGLDTDACFEYGITSTPPSYTITTTAYAIGNGSSNVPVTADITAGLLLLNTEYNFRVVGTNSTGTNYGNNLDFLTGNYATATPTCTTYDATNITADSAVLNGIVNPNALSTTVYFQYGITTTPINYPLSTTYQDIGNGNISIVVTATAGSLAGNTLYNFRVVGFNGTVTNYGRNLTFATLGQPAVCTTTAASNISFNSATLNGVVNPNGFNVTSCIFQYGTTGNYNLSATATPAPGSGTSDVAVSATITGLTEVTAYNFKVVATNAGGTTIGNSVAFNTTAVFSATGGIVTTSEGYTIHTFNSSGTFQVTAGSRNVEVLVVAGGGGGGGQSGYNGNGGGGAGGLVYNPSFAISVGSYPVTVGTGGTGSSPPTKGGNSVFGTITATGGGGGGHGSTATVASSGGSGGGGCASAPYDIGAAGTTGQGNAGGNGNPTTDYPGGGGGGAGAVGSNGIAGGGPGGAGLQYPQFATVGGSPPGWFAGGGGGSNINATQAGGLGGQGGGGNGSCVSGNPFPGSAGTANTGGGGGAGRNINGYNGGSGIVIIRYLTP
jgi:hypothetical protein